MGGSPDQAAATTGRDAATGRGASAAAPVTASAAVPEPAGPRPRIRSHNPTTQPSAPAEAALVTRDAISAV